MFKRNQQARITIVAVNSTTGERAPGLSLTTQVSKDGGALAPTSNTATGIGSGLYSLLLTATEMDAETVVVDASAADTWIDPIELHTEADYTTARAGKLDNLDTTVSSRATQASVNAIPTNPVLVSDLRLDNLDLPISTRLATTDFNGGTNAILAAVGAIPTNPLLTNDARLNTLDASISSRPTLAEMLAGGVALQTTVSDIWANMLNWDDPRLDYLDAPVSSRLAAASYTAPANGDITSILNRVNLIPTNPLLTNDARLNNLDATISSRARPADILVDPGTDKIDGSELATKADVAAVSQSTFYSASSVIVNTGTVISGTVTDTHTHNDVHLIIAESTTPPGIMVTFVFSGTDQSEFPRSVNMIGRYQGSNQHHIDCQAYNYTLATWEQLNIETTGSINNATQDTTYSFPLRSSHVNDATGEMQIRFLHDALGNPLSAAHRLYIDRLEIEKTRSTPMLTLNDIEGSLIIAKQASVLAIPTNPLLTNDGRLNNLDAAISSRLSTAAYTAPDNASITSTLARVNSIPTNPLLTNDARLNNLDATISSRASSVAMIAGFDTVNVTLATINGKVDTAQNILNLLKVLGEGRWKLDHDTAIMTLYGADGITPIQRWQLRNRFGQASVSGIYERIPLDPI